MVELKLNCIKGSFTLSDKRMFKKPGSLSLSPGPDYQQLDLNK